MSAPLPVIAIDGPAASGKGTIATRLAAKYSFAFLDTGLLYRAVGVAVLREGGDPNDPALATALANALDASEIADRLNDPELRSDRAGPAASMVSAIPGVRAALLAFQQNFATTPPAGSKGAVLDGRDIGTVVCPDALVKLYITAAAPVRADRRHKELVRRGHDISYEAVLADIEARDARDMQRSIAPLKPATDAFVLDTSNLTADAAFAAADAVVAGKIKL